ncbi:glycosyltransferase family 4 protein [Phyllobacterium sp. LjRoot231]|uniref:glycosyltransferase family 4 protein n=1 Tax=Phyllobacterium sp. LjRoot231 TaxID=3342289 RepID=UPI003ECDE790
MKFAYFVLPHIGGTYTVFKQLRKGLAMHGIDVHWLGFGKSNPLVNPEWQSEAAFGTMVEAPEAADEQAQARLVAAAVRNGGFDGIFVNVLTDRVQMNIARYLPANIMRIMIVHNITPGTYAAAVAIKDHVHATIGVSERCRGDLVEKYKFDKERTFVIPNAIDIEPFIGKKRGSRDETGLRMLSLGRIEDASKGVFWLPGIMDKSPASVRLTIAGNGPDLEQLKRKLSHHKERVTFLGAVQPDRIPQLLLDHDVLVMPSRFEGYPMTLIEAMAAGCVPIVSHIQGVTDTIVIDKNSGFLFPVGDHTEAARIISKLNADPAKLASASSAAREAAEQAFTFEGMASQYHHVIERVTTTRPHISAPLDLDDWSFPRGLRSGLRTYVPRPVKNWLRVMRERYRYTPFGSFS